LSSVKAVFIPKCANVVIIHAFVPGLVYLMSYKFLTIIETQVTVACICKHNAKCNPLR
jgi:hypothetical protein